MEQDTYKPPTFGLWIRPPKGGLLGLSTKATIVLFAGLIISIIGIMIGGLLIGGICFLSIAFIVFITTYSPNNDGVNLIKIIVERLSYMLRVLKKENKYRSGLFGKGVLGTCSLPGLLATTTLIEHKDIYGQEFCLLYHPKNNTYSCFISCLPLGNSLVDNKTIDSFVAGYSGFLSSLADEPNIKSCSVTINIIPSSGQEIKNQIDLQLNTKTASEFSQNVLDEIKDNLPNNLYKTSCHICLSFTPKQMGNKKNTSKEIAIDLSARLPYIKQNLSLSGVENISYLNAKQLCEYILSSYDPNYISLIDELNANNTINDARLSFSDCGPMACNCTWDYLRHDSSYSTSYFMTSAPKGFVSSNILGSLLSPSPLLQAKRLTILYKLFDSAQSATLVEKDVQNAQGAISGATKIKTADVLNKKAAQNAAEQEAKGATLVEFGVGLTCTFFSQNQLKEVKSLVSLLQGASKLKFRPAYGCQDSAFAFNLGIGVSDSNEIKFS